MAGPAQPPNALKGLQDVNGVVANPATLNGLLFFPFLAGCQGAALSDNPNANLFDGIGYFYQNLVNGNMNKGFGYWWDSTSAAFANATKSAGAVQPVVETAATLSPGAANLAASVVTETTASTASATAQVAASAGAETLTHAVSAVAQLGMGLG